MPHYRIIIKLNNELLQEFVIEDARKDIEIVYLDFRRRSYEKNGAGRVTYFDLVMIAEESLKQLESRKEVLNQENNFGLNNQNQPSNGNRSSKKKREYTNFNITLGARQKNP